MEHDSFNPHFLHSGVFVPHYILSSKRISHGAKLVHQILAGRANTSGRILSRVDSLALEIGEENDKVLEYLHELEKTEHIKILWRSPNSNLLRFSFTRPNWIKGKNVKKRGRATQGRATVQQYEARSKHSRRDCFRYVEHLIDLGRKIDNVGGYTTFLHRSGKRDKQIDEFLTQTSQNLSEGCAKTFSEELRG